MHGQIHDCLRALMYEEYDKATYLKIIAEAECSDDKHFMKFQHYDDAMTVRLLVATAKILDVPLGDALEVYGVYWVKYVLDIGYAPLMTALGPNIRCFAENVDTIHTLLSECYEGIVPPMYRCEPLKDGNCNFHYLSYRQEGLERIAKGVVKGMGKFIYNCSVDIEVVSIGQFKVGEDETLYTACMRINLPEELRNYPTLQTQLFRMTDMCRGPIPDVMHKPTMSAENFTIIFPYNIIYDRSMTIKLVGATLRKFNPNVQVGKKMTDISEIEYPKVPYNAEIFLDYININFVLQTLNADGSYNLRLKGQMIPMDKDRVIFVCSPKLKNLSELVTKKIHLCDLPIYDSTRQFVMVNEVRNAEINISQKLEETTGALKVTHEALEREKGKTDTLLYEMLPRKVADTLKMGDKVPAEKYDDITILFSDVVGFAGIAAAITPEQIVDLLNALYSLMDKVTARHNVYKVETVGSTYMLASGVPDRHDHHAQEVANMALDMMKEVPKVESPLDGSKLKLVIGIHSGPVVSGVIGDKMPRFCLFGDTVNTSSRMMSHGQTSKIHVSPIAFRKLYDNGYVLDDRGNIDVKGKGMMNTYFLLGPPGCGLVPERVPKPPAPEKQSSGRKSSRCCLIL